MLPWCRSVRAWRVAGQPTLLPLVFSPSALSLFPYKHWTPTILYDGVLQVRASVASTCLARQMLRIVCFVRLQHRICNFACTLLHVKYRAKGRKQLRIRLPSCLEDTRLVLVSSLYGSTPRNFSLVIFSLLLPRSQAARNYSALLVRLHNLHTPLPL